MSNEIEQLNEGGTVQFSIREGYFNGYPTSVKVDNELSPISSDYTNLPYIPTDYKNKITKKISSFNGYPMLYNKYNLKGLVTTTNLPLRYISKTKHMWQMKDDILEGYPSLFAIDPDFDSNAFVMHVSDNHYVTPLRAKMLIHKYLSEYMRNRGVYKAPLVEDIVVTPKNKRLLLEWKSPIDDATWQKTIVMLSEVGFTSVDAETNTLTYSSDSDYVVFREDRNTKLNFPCEITMLKDDTELVNNKEYYLTFISVSEAGVYNVYQEGKVIATPRVIYKPLYGEFGEYIGKEEIPVGED